MKYCVTGATGFIGSHLVARLKSQGHWVRAIDCQHHDYRQDLYRQADEFEILDLGNSVSAQLAFHNVDRVYHLAADHGGAGYFHSHYDQPAARNNMRIDLNVMASAESHKVDRLFYASSFCAYPIAKQVAREWPLSEDELFQGEPEQCYGAEKRFATQLFDAGNLDARCGVFATIYGPLQESEGIRAKFPTAIVRRALNATDGEAIELWGDGSQIRTFLYIDDALDRIQTIMETDAYEGPVNVASDESVSVLQCAHWACEFAGVKPVFDHRTDKPTGVAARVPDNTNFRARYGDQFSQLETREGFRRLSEWMASTMEYKAAA
jgi:GDP-D-mannose 3',5'-epimerase